MFSLFLFALSSLAQTGKIDNCPDFCSFRLVHLHEFQNTKIFAYYPQILKTTGENQGAHLCIYVCVMNCTNTGGYFSRFLGSR